MKKRNLKKLAVIGLTSGLMVTCQTAQANSSSQLQFPSEEDFRGPKEGSRRPKGCGGLAQSQGMDANLLYLAVDIPDSSSKNAKGSSTDNSSDPNSQNLGYHLMTEQELLNELNDEGVKLYNSLDAQGKLLARKVASQRCQAANECKGLNACETPDNKCAGKGSCKGKGKCAIADKNLAVKLVAKKMADKRNNLTK